MSAQHKHTPFLTYLPIILAGITLVLMGGMIAKHERHLKSGKSVYVRLAPVDPRSLIQGDYMDLNYDLMLTDDTTDDTTWAADDGETDMMDMRTDDASEPFYDQRHVTLWIETDGAGRLINSAFDKSTLSAQARPLMVTNPSNRRSALYPAAASFMFAEGLAGCYNQASYAHLHVNDAGTPMLVDLVADDLSPLNCEARAKTGETF